MKVSPNIIYDDYCAYLLKRLKSQVDAGLISPKVAEKMYYEDGYRNALFDSICEKAMHSVIPQKIRIKNG